MLSSLLYSLRSFPVRSNIKLRWLNFTLTTIIYPVLWAPLLLRTCLFWTYVSSSHYGWGEVGRWKQDLDEKENGYKTNNRDHKLRRTSQIWTQRTSNIFHIFLRTLSLLVCLFFLSSAKLQLSLHSKPHMNLLFHLVSFIFPANCL